jgi:hypothetical protein
MRKKGGTAETIQEHKNSGKQNETRFCLPTTDGKLPGQTAGFMISTPWPSGQGVFEWVEQNRYFVYLIVSLGRRKWYCKEMAEQRGCHPQQAPAGPPRWMATVVAGGAAGGDIQIGEGRGHPSTTKTSR